MPTHFLLIRKNHFYSHIAEIANTAENAQYCRIILGNNFRRHWASSSTWCWVDLTNLIWFKMNRRIFKILLDFKFRISEDGFDLIWSRFLLIPYKILASVQWKSNMEATNVYWFLHECSLASGENYYEVIKNDCYSTLVNTRSAKESIFTQNSFAFDFTSFSFADSSSDNPSKMAFSLKCELKFCLSNYDCPVNKYCPHYYQLPVM